MNRAAAVLWMLLATAGQAHAAIIYSNSPVAPRPAGATGVGKTVDRLLHQAKLFAAVRNYAGAREKLDDAESVKTTPGEAAAIARTRQSIEATLDDVRELPVSRP
jgi:hypothetical protein